jgi:threonine/homoserine/homoserine lactone efflux protein
MLPLLGDLVPYAVPVALSPLPVIAAVMLLLAPAGAAGAAAFLAGRLATLAALTLVVALLAAQLTGSPAAAERGGWLRIALGLLLLFGALTVWRRRPRGDAAAALPGWMRSLERATPARAAFLGLLLTAANLKELAFLLGAGLILGSAALPFGQALALALGFALLACASIALPLVWVLSGAEGARRGLAAARDWLVRNNPIVIAAVLLVLGAMLIGNGLESL